MRGPRSAALLVLLVGLSGCTGGSGGPRAEPSTPTSSPAQSPLSTPAGPTSAPPKAPARTSCYRLSADQLTQPTNASDPVPCRARHSAQTIFVGKLNLVEQGHALAVDSRQVQRQVAEICPRRFASYVGGTASDRDLGRLRVVWFSPTLAEADAGADWFRCDLVAFGRGDALSQERGRIARGVLAGDGLDRYGLCGTAQPGSAGFERVRCGLPHTWRALATIALDGPQRYPGAAAVRKAGDSDCQDKVRAAEGFALTFTYGWEWPTREQWQSGQHFGYCWRRSG